MLNHEDGPCSERRPDVSADLMRSRFLHRKDKKKQAPQHFSRVSPLGYAIRQHLMNLKLDLERCCQDVRTRVKLLRALHDGKKQRFEVRAGDQRRDVHRCVTLPESDAWTTSQITRLLGSQTQMIPFTGDVMTERRNVGLRLTEMSSRERT